MRNKQFDIMLAIGIIFVLMGHSYQPPFLFYPAYTFHMGLFFFVSGYFFKPKHFLKEKISFIIKKTKTQLIPYFLLLFLFGILTQVLRQFGINLGAELTLNSLFVDVLSRADQFHLYIPCWFLLTLYIVNITAVVIYGLNQRFNALVFLASGCLLYYLLELGKGNWGDWHLEVIRSGFGLFIFGFGYFFKIYEYKLNPLLLKPVSLAALYLLVNMLNVHYGNLIYTILFGTINNELVWVPMLSTMAIILMVYVIAYFLSLIVTENSLLILIGRNTLAIMVWHLTAFLLVNLIFLALGWVSLEKLSDVFYRFEIEKTWMIYLIFGLFVPVFIANLYRKVANNRFLKIKR